MFKKCLAEFLGTAFLVLIGCGVAVLTSDVTATALAFGLSIVAVGYSFGEISGGHFNPAVSLGMAINGRISWKDFGFYLLSQVLGGLFGSLILGLVLNSFSSLGSNSMSSTILTLTNNTNYHAYAIGLLAELILTYLFVFVILMVTSKKDNKMSVLVIGLTLTLVHLIGIKITGTSVNPARSLGPAILEAFTGNTSAIKQIWIFLLGPSIGAALAGFSYEALMNKETSKEKEENK